MNDLFLLQSTKRILGYWWLLIVFCFLGGGIGWLINDLQPPLYEAEARFHIYLDFVRTGEVHQLDKDAMSQTAGWLMSNPGIVNQVIAAASQQGIDVDPEKTLAIFFSEQRGEVWVLRVRYPNPQDAASLANLWAEIGNQTLTEALQHAEQAESYRRFLETLQSCLAQAFVTEPGTAQCAADNIQAIQTNLSTTGQLYLQEKAAARGVSPAINASFENPAVVPNAPIRHQRSTFMLAGTLIGLLLGGWAISSGLVDLFRKNPRAR